MIKRIKAVHEWMKANVRPLSIGIIAGIGVEKFDLLTRWL